MKVLKRVLYLGAICLAAVTAFTACNKDKVAKNTEGGDGLGDWKIASITLTQPGVADPVLAINIEDAKATKTSLENFVDAEFPAMATLIKPMLAGIGLILPAVGEVEFDFEDKGVLNIENLPNKTPDVKGTWSKDGNTVTTNVPSFPTDKLGNYGVFMGLLAGKDVKFTKEGNKMVNKRSGSNLLDLFGSMGGKMGGEAMATALAGLKTKYANAEVTLTLVKKN